MSSRLAALRKKLHGKEILTEMNEPTQWVTTGNFALNYRLSGRFDVGICNKRTFMLWGESGTGKTYLSSNLCKYIQDMGYMVIYLDSEGSISENYMLKVGIDLSPDRFLPVMVDTIEEATLALSEIFGNLSKDDKFVIVLDSLAGLLTEKEREEFSKGETKGEMGQIAKKLKLLVKNLNKKIQGYDAFCILVTHAYQNQNPLNGEGLWICTGGKGFQFFPSFSINLNKLKIKQDDEGVSGVRIKAEVTKTRFAAPFQKCELYVPYNKGINPYDGLLDILYKELKIINKKGGWYSYSFEGEDKKFQVSSFEEHIENLLVLLENHQGEGVPKEDVKPWIDPEQQEEEHPDSEDGQN